MKLSFVISIIIHLFISNTLVINRSIKPKLKKEKIFIVKRITKTNNITKNNIPSNSNHTSNHLKNFSLNSLSPFKNLSIKAKTSANHNFSNPINNINKKLQTTFCTNNIYKTIFRLINSNLYYPKLFADNNFSEKVTGSIVIDSEGNFIEKKSKLKSYNNFMKVLVTKIIRKSLKKNRLTPCNKFKYYTINVHFNFELSTGFPSSKLSSLSQSMLYFYHHHYGGHKFIDKINKVIHPLTTMYINGGAELLTLIDWLPFKTKRKKIAKKYNSQLLDQYKFDKAWR